MLCASSDIIPADESAGQELENSLKMTLFCAHLSCINMFELKAEECFPGIHQQPAECIATGQTVIHDDNDCNDDEAQPEPSAVQELEVVLPQPIQTHTTALENLREPGDDGLPAQSPMSEHEEANPEEPDEEPSEEALAAQTGPFTGSTQLSQAVVQTGQMEEGQTGGSSQDCTHEEEEDTAAEDEAVSDSEPSEDVQVLAQQTGGSVVTSPEDESEEEMEPSEAVLAAQTGGSSQIVHEAVNEAVIEEQADAGHQVSIDEIFVLAAQTGASSLPDSTASQSSEQTPKKGAVNERGPSMRNDLGRALPQMAAGPTPGGGFPKQYRRQSTAATNKAPANETQAKLPKPAPPPAPAAAIPKPKAEAKAEIPAAEAMANAAMLQIEGALLDKLKSHTDKVMARFEKQQVEREKRLVNAMQTSMASVLQKEIQKEVKNVILPACTQGVQQAVAQSVQPAIDAQMKTLHNKIDKNVAKYLDEAVGKGLAGPAVREAFKGCFVEQLIPSFENSVKAMFQQINNTFLSGLEEQVARPLQGRFDKLQNDLVHHVANAAGTLTQTSQQMLQALQMQQTAGNVTSPVFAPVRKKTPLEVLDEKLQQGQLSEALDFALSQEDTEYVMHVCRNDDMIDRFSEDAGAISQPVLCSLIQQLSGDLEVELEIKMEWLQASLLKLDQNDAVAKAMLPSLLEDLSSSLEFSFEQHNNRKDPSHNSIKLMKNLVASLRR